MSTFGAQVGAMATGLEALVKRLEIAVEKLENTGGIAPREGGGVPQGAPRNNLSEESVLHPSVVAFDELISTFVAKFIKAAGAIGGSVLDASKLLESAFKGERTIVLAISQCKVSLYVRPIKLHEAAFQTQIICQVTVACFTQ
jgi:hypothetical protein